MPPHILLFPAEAGIQGGNSHRFGVWIPACAGMSGRRWRTVLPHTPLIPTQFGTMPPHIPLFPANAGIQGGNRIASISGFPLARE